MLNEKKAKRVAPIAATVVGIVLVCLLWVLVGAKPNPSDNADSPLLGQPAPAVVTTTLEDKPFDLSRRKGSWVVFNFFNSTCVPCRIEHPLLLTFVQNQLSTDNPAEMYTVINDDNDSAVLAFFAENKGDWQKIRDNDGSIAVAFGVAKVPETWIIDPNGYVRLRIAGQLSEGLLDEQMSILKVQFGS